MSPNLPDFDPYAVLGVDKSAPSSEIKTAYRKLILKCHPDKIQDESLRSKAVDHFQKVQESYEILSDDTRRQIHDQEVRLAALRNEVKAHKSSAGGYSSSRGTSSREFRDGRMYEERVPADAAFFTDSDEPRYTEEPSHSHKYDDGAKRPHTKVTDERRKSKSTSYSTSSPRFAKHSDREYARTERHGRDKLRTKERRRDVSDKYERTTAAYVYSDDDDDFSSSDVEAIRSRTKVEFDYRRSPRESVPRRSKTEYPTRPRKYYLDSESETGDSADEYTKYDKKYASQETFVKEYINRKRDPSTQDRPSRSSRYADYDYDDRDRRYAERESTRYTSSRSYETSSTHTPRRKSFERGISPTRGYERERTPPSMNSRSSSQRVSSSRGPPPIARAATVAHTPRTRREGLSRSESNVMPTLVNMVATPRSRPRGNERNDSGYSSGPGTPEMPQSTSSKIRYKVETPTLEREPIIVEPMNPRYRDSPPPRAERERSSTSSRTPKSTRYTYEPNIRTVRPAPMPKSTSSPSTHYREIRPDILLDERRRRQPAY